MKRILLASAIAFGLSFTAQAQECGKVTIADMNWGSATLLANIDAFILEHGYGCEAEIVPGDTMPTGTSMIEKGEPDLAPEMWFNSMHEALEKGVEEGRLLFAGDSLSDGGEEGFWVPAYLVKKDPSLATIKGIIKNAALFEHPEDDEKHAFYGCPAGWNCEISSGNLFKALKLADYGFEIVDPGSGAGLSGTIAKAYERGEPWFGYYWAPTAVLGKYKMVKVDLGAPADKDYFESCITAEDCENPKVISYPPTKVETVVTTDLTKRAPAVLDYLSKRSFTNAEMNEQLAWMEENQAEGEFAMAHFMTTQKSKWSAWLNEDVAAKVSKAVADL